MIKGFHRFRVAGFFMFLAVTAVFSAVAMLLWNWLMPDIFGLPLLNYWQAAGILVLARILFGGIGPFPHDRGFHAHNGNKLREKWMNMSADERKAFFNKERSFSDMFRDRFPDSEQNGNEP